MKTATVSTPGKIILFGEHSVVYNKKGIASAIDKHSTVKIKENTNEFISLFLKDFNIRTRIRIEEAVSFAEEIKTLASEKKFDQIKKLSKNPINPIKAVIGTTINKDKNPSSFDMVISSRIPKTGGLGSGSSVFAGVSATILSLSGNRINKKKIAENAYLGDVIAHAGTPSGIDTSTVTYGGFIEYKKTTGVKPLKIKSPLLIVIGDTGIPARTKTAVTQVRRMLEEKPLQVKRVLEEMDSIAEEGIRQVKENNFEMIGKLMNENQECLRGLRVSHPKLEKLIKASLRAGALGAKLSGGGKGGIMIALAESKAMQKKIARSIENTGGKAIITTIGVEGVKREGL